MVGVKYFEYLMFCLIGILKSVFLFSWERQRYPNTIMELSILNKVGKFWKSPENTFIWEHD